MSTIEDLKKMPRDCQKRLASRNRKALLQACEIQGLRRQGHPFGQPWLTGRQVIAEALGVGHDDVKSWLEGYDAPNGAQRRELERVFGVAAQDWFNP